MKITVKKRKGSTNIQFDAESEEDSQVLKQVILGTVAVPDKPQATKPEPKK